MSARSLQGHCVGFRLPVEGKCETGEQNGKVTEVLQASEKAGSSAGWACSTVSQWLFRVLYSTRRKPQSIFSMH